MRRLALLAPLALLSACVVRAYDTRPAPVAYAPPMAQPVYYQYNGEHPLPDAEGGGWCPIDGIHTHPYAPGTDSWASYRYTNQVYVYSAPRVVWYFGFHTAPDGSYCYLQGRHSHGYVPSAAYRDRYTWRSGQRYYTYRGPYVAPRVHTAVAPTPPQRYAPPRPGYIAPQPHPVAPPRPGYIAPQPQHPVAPPRPGYMAPRGQSSAPPPRPQPIHPVGNTHGTGRSLVPGRLTPKTPANRSNAPGNRGNDHENTRPPPGH
jgi:hypothetical protein